MDELLAMGYSQTQATQALEIAGGDMEQAVGYLLMGEQSRQGFDHSSSTIMSSTNVPATKGDTVSSSAFPRISLSGIQEQQEVNVSMLNNTNVSEHSLGLYSSEIYSNRMGGTPASTAATVRPGRLQKNDSGEIEEQEQKKITELLQMGYNASHARQALAVSHGDLDQAINFLLMGDSKLGFLVDEEEAAVTSAATERSLLQEGTHDDNIASSAVATEDDEAIAASLQQEELLHGQTTAAAPLSLGANAQQHSSPAVPMGPDSSRYNSADVPRMVATQSSLTQHGAEPFCACHAASKFLSGGVVTSDFLNEILGGAVEIYRKTDRETHMSVEEVLQRYGKSHMQLMPTSEPQNGMFLQDDLQSALGLRKQLTLCRNNQGPGWQLMVLEIPGLECFCICLPPKGTKNKFWFLDFRPRSSFRVPGAYARVHNTLMQLQEAVESVFLCFNNQSTGCDSFVIHPVSKTK